EVLAIAIRKVQSVISKETEDLASQKGEAAASMKESSSAMRESLLTIVYVPQRFVPAPLDGSEYYLKWLAESVREFCNPIIITTNGFTRSRVFLPPQILKEPGRSHIGGIPVERCEIARKRVVLASLIGSPLNALLGRPLPNLGTLGEYLDLMSSGLYAPGIENRLMQVDADIVHTSGASHPTNWLAAKACTLSGKHLVVTPFVNMALLPQAFPSWIFKVFAQSSAIIAATNSEASFLVNSGVPSKKIHTIPPGINLDEWKDANGTAMRRELGLDSNSFV